MDCIAIGIDPGKKTGVAVWNCDKQEWIHIKTMDFWQCYNHVTVFLKSSYKRLFVVAENPSGNNPVWHGKGKPIAVRQKIAQRVGRNKQEADLLIDGFKKRGIPVRRVTPKQSKWDADTFKKIAGYEGRTNEHMRDAGRLVVGLRALPDLQWQKMIDELETEAN